MQQPDAMSRSVRQQARAREIDEWVKTHLREKRQADALKRSKLRALRMAHKNEPWANH